MVKNVLLLLGESPSGLAARACARKLARAQDARITSLSGVDLAFIEAPMPGAIGGAAYHAQMETSLKTEAVAARRRAAETFAAECAGEGLAPIHVSFDGDPFEQVTAASATADLVITGHDVTFRGTGSEPHSDTLNRLLFTTPRPVLVCPDDLPPEGEVLVAYDGSLPAMRALQLFVLLGAWTGRRVQVVSVDTRLETARHLAERAAEFLKLHGYDAAARPLRSAEPAPEVLAAQAALGTVELLVMGAYGHRGLKELLFGSTTQSLVGAPSCCIFLYH
ncbi:universal stress protein [Xanthobacter sp. KR7-225]|uniref:universal stress protein n=1 Tax=Xanthobacter sp. KR7-225 TaxID=3156613 RepID=UPI0032B56CBD